MTVKLLDNKAKHLINAIVKNEIRKNFKMTELKGKFVISEGKKLHYLKLFKNKLKQYNIDLHRFNMV